LFNYETIINRLFHSVYVIIHMFLSSSS